MQFYSRAKKLLQKITPPVCISVEMEMSRHANRRYIMTLKWWRSSLNIFLFLLVNTRHVYIHTKWHSMSEITPKAFMKWFWVLLFAAMRLLHAIIYFTTKTRLFNRKVLCVLHGFIRKFVLHLCVCRGPGKWTFYHAKWISLYFSFIQYY